MRIHAPEDFSLLWYRKFREVYKIEKNFGTTFIIDFINTAYLSTSALGMILLLKDHVGLIEGQVNLVNPTFKQPYDLLKTTGFDRMFNITFEEHVSKNKTKTMLYHI